MQCSASQMRVRLLNRTGWEAPVAVHDPGEAEANIPEVLELLEGTIAGYTMSTWGEHVRSQDPAVQEQYCHAIETGADLSFAADGLDVTPEEAAAARCLIAGVNLARVHLPAGAESSSADDSTPEGVVHLTV